MKVAGRKKYMIRCLAVALSMSLVFSGCGKRSKRKNGGGLSSFWQEASTVEMFGKLMERSFPASEEYVKLTGRIGENNDIRWLIHSASKVEFRMKGTKASIVIRGDGAISGSQTTKARFAVYVNGTRTIDHIVTKLEETLEIFSSDEEQDVEISIVKLSEASCSVFGIKSIDVTASKDIEPLPDKRMKIEFIGDSITCGYGVDDENRDHHFSTGIEDATKTYAYKTAEALDADCSFFSYSGYGIISGYTDNGQKVEYQRIPDYYEILGTNSGSADSVLDLSIPWDFSKFVPDQIVLNLGSNDETYVGEDAGKKRGVHCSIR